jgi:hypothetical protein
MSHTSLTKKKNTKIVYVKSFVFIIIHVSTMEIYICQKDDYENIYDCHRLYG